jgi:hypothetical protein
MAVTVLKKVRTPLRYMGEKSTTTLGPILYFEYGTIIAEDDDTEATIPTDLTQVVMFIPTVVGTTGATAVAGSYIDASTITGGEVTFTFTDPGGAVEIPYVIVGTAETFA